VNLTDQLRQLAALHSDGQLSDEEFASAKSQLLAEGAEPSAPAVPEATPPDIEIEEAVFRSSRWSSGNLFFPDQLTLAGDGMHFRKGALFGSQEEHIKYRAVASLRIKNGIFLANLNVETSGGSQPIFMNGLWKSAAREIQAAVQAAQTSGPR
jgi:hypothetical protein